MNLPLLLNHFDGVESEGYGRYVALCPCHEDTNPSVALSQDARTGNILAACRACPARMPQIAQALGLQQRDFFGDPGAPGAVSLPPVSNELSNEELSRLADYLKTVRADIEPAEKYLEERFAMPLETARLLGLGYDDGGPWSRPTGFNGLSDGNPRLIIPFKDPDGNDLGFQARRIDPCSNKERWRGPTGGAWATVACFGWNNPDPVVICEGPTDALAAASKGYASIGIRGAGVYSNEAIQNKVREFVGERSAVVVADAGETGQQAAKAMADALGINAWTPDLGDDLADHLANGGTLVAAEAVASGAVPEVDPVETALTMLRTGQVNALLEDEEALRILGELYNGPQSRLYTLAAFEAEGVDGITVRRLDALRSAANQAYRRSIGVAAHGPIPAGGGNGGNGGGVHAPIPEGFDPDNQPVVIWNVEDQLFLRENALREAMNAYEGGLYFVAATGKYVKKVGDELRELKEQDVDSMLSQMAHWRVINGARETADIPSDATKTVCGSTWECSVPAIKRRVEVPFMLGDGSVVSEPGYYAESGIYYLPKANDPIYVPDVPEVITDEHVAQAKAIFDDAVEGFVFKNPASKTNLIAMTLTSPLRELFNHNPMVPFLVSTAPQSGSGKGTAIRVPLSTAGVGPMSLGTTAYNSDENEFEKKLVAKLIKKDTYIFLDNIRSNVASSVMEQMLTAANYDGRTLGLSEVNSLSTLVLWVATLQADGTLNKDLTRRCVPVELIKNYKGNWQHHNIEAYLAEKRGELLWACFVVARKWLQDGKPKGTARLDGYGGWTEVIGGMVEHVLGYESFLGNHEEFRKKQSDNSMDLDSILERWLEVYGEEVHPARAAVEDYADPTLHKMLGIRTNDPNPRAVVFAMQTLLQKNDCHIVNGTHMFRALGKRSVGHEGVKYVYRMERLPE